MRAIVVVLLCGGCSVWIDAGGNRCADPCEPLAADAGATPDDAQAPDVATSELPCLAAPFQSPEPVTLMIHGLEVTDDLSSPSLTGEMDMLYFSLDEGDVQVWEARSIASGLVFGPATMLDSVSDDNEDDEFPRISEDGTILRFVSDRGGSSWDEVYESRRESGFVWSAPVQIGTEADDPFPPLPLAGAAASLEVWSNNDHLENWAESSNELLAPVNELGQLNAPWVSRDGLVLFFALDESPHELFYSTRPSATLEWSEPIAVRGLERQARQTDSDPWLSPDLCTLYFSRETRDPSGSVISRQILRAKRSPQ